MATINTRDFAPPYRVSAHPTKPAWPLKPAPPLKHEIRLLEDQKTVLEKDVGIKMRDGITLYADVYRPEPSIAAKTPTIVFFAPFGKHGGIPRELFHGMDVDFSKLSQYAAWEIPDPLRWCGEWAYSFIIVDPRATWYSEGAEANYFSPEEGRDGYDIVEWVAMQSWSTGKVGWGAVSYFAMSIYQTAVLKPPHLAAIMPWEGISDIYREMNNVGGIPSVPFQHFWMNLTGTGLNLSEDHGALILEHPLYDEIWQSKVVDWSLIDIPAFSVTGWSSLGVHLRGTVLAWKNFTSQHKYLLIHAGKEWSEFYKEENVLKQKAFFDRFLKQENNQVDSWPAIQYDVRTSATVFERRSDSSFPPHEAQPVPLYLSKAGKLEQSPSHPDGEAAFESFQSHLPNSIVHFDYVFQKRTEITGDSAVKLFVQALQFPDVDLNVVVQKINAAGEEVKFWHVSQKMVASAGMGWLRASHRELDQEKSRPEKPIHLHRRRMWLRPAEIVEVQVEIWPSSTVWEEGETLRLAVSGNSFIDDEGPVSFKAPRHNYGEVRIWYGGKHDSQLLIPVYKDE